MICSGPPPHKPALRARAFRHAARAGRWGDGPGTHDTTLFRVSFRLEAQTNKLRVPLPPALQPVRVSLLVRVSEQAKSRRESSP